jgi:hypothetical protein
VRQERDRNVASPANHPMTSCAFCECTRTILRDQSGLDGVVWAGGHDLRRGCPEAVTFAPLLRELRRPSQQGRVIVTGSLGEPGVVGRVWPGEPVTPVWTAGLWVFNGRWRRFLALLTVILLAGCPLPI